MRLQSILPISTEAGQVLGYVWLPSAAMLGDGSTVTVEGRSYVTKFRSYHSVAFNQRVEYAYLPVPYHAVTTSGTCPWFSSAVYATDEEPNLPWQQLGHVVNAPSRATPSVLTQFLSGRNFNPLSSAFEVDRTSEHLVPIVDADLFGQQGAVFRDYLLAELAWPLVNGLFPSALSSINADRVVFLQPKFKADPPPSLESPPLSVFLLTDPERAVVQVGLPNVLRIVKTDESPIESITSLEIDVVFSSLAITQKVCFSISPR